MDVPVAPASRRRRRWRRVLLACAGGAVVTSIAVPLARLEPALPAVERSSIHLGTVERGELVRQVRGSGSLVPEQIRFVQADFEGRIESILVEPGAVVAADTVLMELDNPELDQAAFDAEWQLRAAEARLVHLRAQLDNERLALRSAIAGSEAESAQAEIDARVNEDLAEQGLVSASETQRSRARADGLRERHAIDLERLDTTEQSTAAQLAAQQAEVERARALLERRRQQVAALRVRAGVDGVLQQTGDAAALQLGQRVTPGATLAKIVEPSRLKAVLEIPETQARDVQTGQHAEIDTRNGVVPGRVVRVDPAAQNGTVTVDVTLEAPLPRGARPESTVDGIIELERLTSVLFVARPVQGQSGSTVALFRLTPDGAVAERVAVKLGQGSVRSIEVLDGLEAGDRVVLSDMAPWSDHERIRLR